MGLDWVGVAKTTINTLFTMVMSRSITYNFKTNYMTCIHPYVYTLL